MQHLIFSFILYIVIFATGLAGLIYQVTWQKYLSRLLGSDSIATAIILAAFLGGLSLGYYLCGKLTVRVKNHFKAYAILEGIIGVWCLNFPLIFNAVESFTRQWHFSPPFLIIAQGFFCSALLMGIPTVCMGGTVPFLTRGISRNIGEATHVHANVYAVNTAGAFIGTLLAGFYLIPEYGLPVTVMGTGFLNLSAFVFFYFFREQEASCREQVTESREQVEDPTATCNLQPATSYPPVILYAIAFLSGFYVMTLENVLIRISNLSLGSSGYSFSLIVSVFIFSIAVGSYVVGRFRKIPARLLFANQLFITLLLLLVYLSLDTWPYWAHVIRIAFQFNIVSMIAYYLFVFFVLSCVLILPVGFMGATVPIAFHEIKRDLKNVGNHSGILFSVNTVGNLCGSLIGGIVFYYFFNHAGIFLSAVLFAAISTLLAAWRLPKSYKILSGILAVSLFLFSISAPYYHEKNFIIGTFRTTKKLLYSLKGPETFFKNFYSMLNLKFYKDGPAATVSVVEFPKDSVFGAKPMAVIVNGKSDSSTLGDIYTIKLLAHLPALFAEKRDNVMVIGLGTGVTAGELTLYPDAENIDIAEISPSIIEALPYFQKFNYNLHKNPKVRIHTGDAFRILGRSEKKWDIVISEPSNPWVSGVDLLFTQEFYNLVKNHLTESGILVQWAHIYSASPEMVGMIINTVHKTFKYTHVFVANPADILIMASNKNISKQDILNAEGLLQKNEAVKNSLEMINIKSVDGMLIRQIWSPSFVADKFGDFGLQTLDNPRLHYIAGRNFFMEKSMPPKYLLNASSAPYFQDFLLARKYENWSAFSLSQEKFDEMMLSVKDKSDGRYLPMAKSLRIKACLSNLHDDLISEKEKKSLDAIPFIIELPKNEEDWGKIELEGKSFREKAQKLLPYTEQIRDWIIPYPIEGLKNLLENGMEHGTDAYEKNWCALQLALLLSKEKNIQKDRITSVLNRTVKEKNGKIAIKDKDRKLLEAILKIEK